MTREKKKKTEREERELRERERVFERMTAEGGERVKVRVSFCFLKFFSYLKYSRTRSK